MALALAMSGMAIGGYFFGMSEGLKKEKRSNVKSEVIIGAVAVLLGISASVQV